MIAKLTELRLTSTTTAIRELMQTAPGHTQPIEPWAAGREYRRRLKKAFDAQQIEIPFPHRTLYFGEASPPFQVLQQRRTAARAATESDAKQHGAVTVRPD